MHFSAGALVFLLSMLSWVLLNSCVNASATEWKDCGDNLIEVMFKLMFITHVSNIEQDPQ